MAAGPVAYDSVTKFLYMADVRRSQGIFRLKYDPTADGGQGNLDLTSLFAMAGNPTGARISRAARQDASFQPCSRQLR